MTCWVPVVNFRGRGTNRCSSSERMPCECNERLASFRPLDRGCRVEISYHRQIHVDAFELYQDRLVILGSSRTSIAVILPLLSDLTLANIEYSVGS